jgi:hypothetical protein
MSHIIHVLLKYIEIQIVKEFIFPFLIFKMSTLTHYNLSHAH